VLLASLGKAKDVQIKSAEQQQVQLTALQESISGMQSKASEQVCQCVACVVWYVAVCCTVLQCVAVSVEQGERAGTAVCCSKRVASEARCITV